jgi:hypothetical protein
MEKPPCPVTGMKYRGYPALFNFGNATHQPFFHAANPDAIIQVKSAGPGHTPFPLLTGTQITLVYPWTSER